jgi:hypothetical protein
LRIFSVIFLLLFSINSFAVTYTVPRSFLPGQKGAWAAIKQQLRSPNREPIVLLWSGVGGYDYIADPVIDAIRDAQRFKSVTIKVVGSSVSMHALVLCRVGNVHFNQGSLTFHAGRDINTNRYESSNRTYAELRGCERYLNNYDKAQIAERHQRVTVYPNGKKVIQEDWK